MFQTDTRGSSITVEYVLTLLVALSLLAGVSAAVGPLDDRQEDRIVEQQLELAGTEIAVQLEHQHRTLQEAHRAERIAETTGAGGGGPVSSVHSVETPDEVASGTYTVQITDNSSILLTPGSGSPTVEVPIRSEIPVSASSGAPGGDVQIAYNSTDEEFLLRSHGGSV